MTNIDYAIGYILDTYIVPSIESTSSYNMSIEIIENYKEWVECHRGWRVIQDASSRSREKAVQRTLHGVAMMCCKTNNLDISPEYYLLVAFQTFRLAERVGAGVAHQDQGQHDLVGRQCQNKGDQDHTVQTKYLCQWVERLRRILQQALPPYTDIGKQPNDQSCRSGNLDGAPQYKQGSIAE